ncbi:MAG: YciI family protein [Nevskia sp.]|nr:YciI family protein [Nevskia sp.]
MSYALLILEERARRTRRSRDDAMTEYDSMQRFGASLNARGILRGGDALKPDAEGVRVSAREGRPLLLDGPFAESKEMIGGFFLIDVASRAEAVAIAAECPATAWATVEVREIGTCHDQ